MDVYFSSLAAGVIARTPAAATSTVVPITVAPMLTAVETTVTAASTTLTTAHPLKEVQISAKWIVDRLFFIGCE